MSVFPPDLVEAVTTALRHQDPFEETLDERATKILQAILPTFRKHVLDELAGSDKSFGTHLDLLTAWVELWAGDPAFPAKLPETLHMRTCMALVTAGRATPVIAALLEGSPVSPDEFLEQVRRAAKPQVSEDQTTAV